MKVVLISGLCGLLFALGLGLGGMTDPSHVVGFLDLAGNWDPSLAFVMAGALATHALFRLLIVRRNKPVLADAFPALSKAGIDRRLVLGAALFGAGWGLSGYCPGPVLTSVGSGAPTVLVFTGAMLSGMLLFQWMESAIAKVTARAGQATAVEVTVMRR